MTSEMRNSPQTRTSKLNSYPFWSPRFWYGMRAGDYLGLLYRNRFQIHPVRWPMALILGPATAVNSALSRLQRLFYEQAIQDTEISQPPVFIVGHWRSGTTFMHELLIRDPQFGFPTTYECFAPHHFLVSDWILPKTLWFLLPSRRPQDNMPTGFDRPQEDEFALVSLGAPTTYYRMAFPNRPVPFLNTLNMEGMDAEDLQRFQQSLLRFLKALTLKQKKQLVLKSPPHTGRIRFLTEMFPGAKFIHLVRDPYEVFSSMRRAWQAFDSIQGFQIPHHERLDEFILEAFARMYEGFEKQRPELDEQNICDVRYEDLAEHPVRVVQQVYDRLDLGDFKSVRPQLTEHVASLNNYQPNRHDLSADIKSQIDDRWGPFIKTYGY